MKIKNNVFFKKIKNLKILKLVKNLVMKKIVSSLMIQNYALLIGDKNPLHYKSKKKKQFHNLCSWNVNWLSCFNLVRLLHFSIKNNLLLSINFNFKKPVLPNQKVKGRRLL